MGFRTAALLLVVIRHVFCWEDLFEDEHLDLMRSSLMQTSLSIKQNSVVTLHAGATHQLAEGHSSGMLSLGEALVALATETEPHSSMLMAAEGYYRAVSITMHCVMFLCVLTLVMYMLLAIARNIDEFSNKATPSLATRTLTIANRSIVYPPMMCSLFVAVRMHALSSTAGLGEPQKWVKMCMVIASVGMTVQFLVVLILPLAVKGSSLEALEDFTGEHSDIHPRLDHGAYLFKAAEFTVMGLQVITMLMVYGGVLAVIVGIFTFSGGEGQQLPSPSFVATTALTILYFFTHLCVYLANSQDSYLARKLKNLRSSLQPSALRGPALCAASAVRPAPMMAVLYLMCRMRAMEMDAWVGRPQGWALVLFTISTAILYLQAILSAVVGAIGKEEVGYYGWVDYTAPRWLHIVRHILAAGLCGTIMGVIVSANLLKMPDGTEPIFPPTLKCVEALAILYFACYALLHVARTCKNVFDYELPKLQSAAEAAGVSVNFAPMVSILFVMARMRAQQVTNNAGAPQQWAQLAMYAVTLATFLQSLCCLVLPVLLGSRTTTDDQGHPVYNIEPMVGAYAVTAVKYFVLLALIGGISAICISAYELSPATANYEIKVDKQILYLLKLGAVVLGALLFALLLSSAKVVGLAIKFAIESIDESVLGVKIEVGNAILSVWHGVVNVTNIAMKNPSRQHFSSEAMVKVGCIVVDIDIWKLITSLGKQCEIRCLRLTGVQVNVEKASMASTSNAGIVVDHLKGKKKKQFSCGSAMKSVRSNCFPSSSAAAERALKEEKEKQKNKKQFKLTLHALHIEEVCANLVVTDKGPLFALDLATISYDDLSDRLAEHAMSQDVVILVVTTLLKSVLKNTEFFKKLVKGMAHSATSKLTHFCSAHHDEELPEEPEQEPGMASGQANEILGVVTGTVTDVIEQAKKAPTQLTK